MNWIFKNIPNILSAYRLLTFPVILFLAIVNIEKAFAILLCINLVTDMLDGLIARTFKLQTEFGARLDSIADFGTYILAIVGIFVFKWPYFEPYKISFFIFLALFLFAEILAVVKFKRMASLHLYSWKIGGYLQGIFFFILFIHQFNFILYCLAIGWGICAFAEHIVVQFMIKEMHSNAKGLYWIIKSKHK